MPEERWAVENMENRLMTTDTIAAIATAMGNSGIGIIRISGDRALEVADRVFRPKNRERLCQEQKAIPFIMDLSVTGKRSLMKSWPWS